MISWIAVCFAAGIAVGEWLGVSVAVALGATCAAVLAAVLARWRDRWVGIALMLVGGVVGVLAVASARPRAPPELVDGKPWLIDAVVARPPERAFGSSRLLVDLSTVERDGARREARGRVWLVLGGDPAETLLPGDRVRFTAGLRVPRGFLNPGAPDAQRRAASEGAFAIASVHDPTALVKLDVPLPFSTRASPARAIAAARARLLARLPSLLEGEERALLASLVLGDRGDVDRALDEDFRVAGVSHVLSVSGLHLAVAAFLFYVGLAWLLLRLPNVGRARAVRRWAALAALPATVAYTLLTGSQVATVRACAMALVWLVAVALDRRATAAEALGMAALAVLVASPLTLFDPSFQLSFAAAMATALLAPRWSPTMKSGTRRRLRAIAIWTARLVAASAAAILATLPIAAWHFSQLAPAGVLSNLVVVPLAELGIVPIGLSGVLLDGAGVPPGSWLVMLAGFLARGMASFVRWFASWAPSWHVMRPSAVEMVAWYAALIALAVGARRRVLWTIVCAIVIAASVATQMAAARASTSLRATFLDVGQGDACVIELPGGEAIVVDGGGSFSPAFDPGRQVIAPFLWQRGIRRLALVVLSHPHPDHANGLPFLVENFEVGEVWTNGQESGLPAALRLEELAARRALRLGRPRAVEIAGVRVRPRAPLDSSGEVAIDEEASENDNSLVVEVVYGGRRILFTGDLEVEGEAALAARGGVSADVIKVAHHGSKTSSTRRLVDAVHPDLAVISVGERNRWGFPNPAVVARWESAGAQVLRTDAGGAVALTIERDGRMKVETVR